MLTRCYYQPYQAKHPSYVGCVVHEDWLSFSIFKTWFDANYIDGYQLDKDLLFPGNKEYSSKTCIFVPQWLNKFVTESTASRGNYLIGVCAKRGKFDSYCSNPITKKKEWLGTFLSEKDAHNKWKERKRHHVDVLQQELDLIDVRLYPNLIQKYQ